MCVVEMSVFWSGRFNNSLDDLIQAKVIAVNSRGESVASLANSIGATV